MIVRVIFGLRQGLYNYWFISEGDVCGISGGRRQLCIANFSAGQEASLG